MAEGVLGGLQGGEGGPEAEAGAEARVNADAYAAALAADQAKSDAGVARAAETFLREQALLLKAQREDAATDRALRLWEAKLRRFGLHVRNVMQVLTALFLVTVAVALVWMAIEAITSRSVVVEAFNAPPALGASGVSGQVVAAGVQDQLQKLADATRATTKGLNVQNAWSSDVKIDVPETGVSIGDISRLLHEHFSHDLHIGGDLIQTPATKTSDAGLALTIRGDGVPPQTFTGGAADLEKLTTQATEYAYGQSQPLRFAAYLVTNSRNADAVTFLPGAYARAASDGDRAFLANQWGNALLSLGRHAQATEKYRLAIQLNPGFWYPRANLILATAVASGEEAAWRESQEFLSLAAPGPVQDRPEFRLLVNAASFTWDLPLLLKAIQADAAHNAGAGTNTTIDGPSVADTYALMHDPAHAALYIATSDQDDSTTKAEAAMLSGYAALDRGDPIAAVAPLEAFWAAWLNDPVISATYYDNGCLLGLAYGLTGRQTEAEAVFKRVGPWSRCYAARGQMLEHLGDLPGAERAWAEGLRVSPDLPFVYMARGLSELKRADLKAAEADLSAACARAPHFADPLKAWGDVLAQENHWQEALAKYDEALKYAPAWAELQTARTTAAGHKLP